MHKSDLDNFEALLRSQLDAFLKLKTLHEELQRALDECKPGNLSSIRKRQEQANLELTTGKTRLAPLMVKWRKLEKDRRNVLLRGNIGKLLDHIEKTALDINYQYDKLIKKTTANRKSSAQVVEISDIINLYR